MALLAGCARYAPQPVVPAQTGAQLDGRRLDDPGLQAFFTRQSGSAPAVWPPAAWDLPALTLAAFYFHPDLAVARAQWQVAAAGLKTAGARPNPSVSVTPSYDGGIPDNFSPWLVPVTFDLPIETAGKRGKRLAEALKVAESARWNFVSAAWQVRSQVRDCLLNLQFADRRAALLESQFKAESEMVRRLEQRLAAGAISRPELTTAQMARNRVQLDWADAQAKAGQARSRLAEALGVGLEAVTNLTLNFPAPAAAPETLTAPEARRRALCGRADILGALADYAAAEADLNLQVAKQFPDLHLGPGYAWNNGNAGDSQWSLGLTLELPILDQNQGPIAEAAARRKLAGAKFLALQAQVIAQIDRAKAGLAAAQQQVATGNTLLRAAERQAAAVNAQVQTGAAEPLDYLSAEMDLNAVRLAQLEGEAQFQSAVGALEDALQQPVEGGGAVWNNALSEIQKESSHE